MWISEPFLLVIPTVYNYPYIMYNVFMRGAFSLHILLWRIIHEL